MEEKASNKGLDDKVRKDEYLMRTLTKVVEKGQLSTTEAGDLLTGLSFLEEEGILMSEMLNTTKGGVEKVYSILPGMKSSVKRAVVDANRTYDSDNILK